MTESCWVVYRVHVDGYEKDVFRVFLRKNAAKDLVKRNVTNKSYDYYIKEVTLDRR